MKDNLQLATEFLYSNILGRYVTMNHINPFLENLHSGFKISTVGFSVEKNPIKSIQFGEGKTKILVWSQMHGNESTTTKGLIDYLNYLNLDKKEFENISKNSSFFLRDTVMCWLLPLSRPVSPRGEIKLKFQSAKTHAGEMAFSF